ncbi:hypothetical protein KAH55_11665 [bacterium]|nr:hypothetical protein [bacterium]
MKNTLVIILMLLFVSVPILGAEANLIDQCSGRPAKFSVQVPHSAPKCQWNTLTCWAFATTSFLESEILRETDQTVELSRMWVVYHAWLLKADNFAKHHGDAQLAPGGLPHDVLTVIRRFGIVRQSDYPGIPDDSTKLNHQALDKCIIRKLNTLAKNGGLNRMRARTTIMPILDQFLGRPPANISWENQSMTPVEFAGNILKIQPDQYAQVTSFTHLPWYRHAELVLPDNWQHYRHFLNVPLAEFQNLVHHALQQGYSMVIDMDLSESGYGRKEPCAVLVPEFLAADSLTETVRTAFFEQKTTSDDHLQHLVGYAPADSVNNFVWYLIKDSLDWSFKSYSGGYVYMREDYLKMKVLSFMVHREFLENEMIPKRH